jgi:hypothetical protein
MKTSANGFWYHASMKKGWEGKIVAEDREGRVNGGWKSGVDLQESNRWGPAMVGGVDEANETGVAESELRKALDGCLVLKQFLYIAS